MSGQQMITFDYRLDEGEFAALTEKLNELAGSKARTHIARALNKTATSARVKLAGKAQESYTVKTGGFRKDMQIKRATAGDLQAIIRSHGNTLNVHYFKWKANPNNRKGSSGVKIDVVRSGLKQMGMNGNKAFVHRQAKKSGGSASLVFVRPQKARLPIYIMKSKSTPYMLGSNRVWTPSRPAIQSDLKKYMEQQIKLLLR